jgi:hypothetical protein
MELRVDFFLEPMVMASPLCVFSDRAGFLVRYFCWVYSLVSLEGFWKLGEN